ncbi:hypothetical protein [Streptomyces sp. URMC 129]|uniref:hypothetical protein n=1 Tax=Streptomyces sp. URMC 129 TaxID=3423407 RepID=UPI003F1DDB1D
MPDGIVGAVPAKTHPSNNLCGGVVVQNSTTSTAFLTIPAGRTWRGTISVCAANNRTTAAHGDTRVVTAGTNAVPAADTILAVAVSFRDTAATVSTLGPVSVTAPAGNAVTLNLVNSLGTTYSGSASAVGELLE